ncbi:C40 family peptidase [Kineothrix sp. MSJ-39]|uniref:C40 family peptidase n=1 Tax=Kineothrix sp. MSJ-39 TaxID=2841533 RepID=UPI001C0FC127|nr:C40 family peptidase [Kineothrix sp. MSJ-39]MBU5429267.1 C40 family peptidase [Kineothrix sp. MSJ-39]
MFHKKGLKKQIFTLVLAAAMICQSQTASAAAVSLQAGAQNALTTPSLQVTGTEGVQTISVDGMQQAETEAKADNSDVALTAGAGVMVSSPLYVAPEDMDEQEYDEEETAGAAYGYTNLGIAQVADHLNVRETAEDGSKIVGKMENDTGCEILGIEGDKAHITSGSVEGYVSLDYILTGKDAVAQADSVVKELATVNADGLKLREEPSLDAPVYDMVAYGEELEVLDNGSDWVGVDFDGNELYVSADYVTVDTKLKTALNMTEFLYGAGVSDVRVELCEYAKQFVGNPYVWGGTSLTKGADCSGFVLSVFAKYGISLPHSSRAQANSGTRVKMSEAKPGDLVFYAKGGRINHVAIYIGGGQVISASSPKTGIRIASAYYRTPVAVTRILQD